MDTLPPSPLLSSPRLCYLAHATLRHAVPCRAMPRRGAPLTKETCSLPAAARALASRRRDALLTILGQDSLSLPFSFSLSLSLSRSFFYFLCPSLFLFLDDMLPRAGRSSGLYFTSRGFCGLSGGKDNPLSVFLLVSCAPYRPAGSHRVKSRRDARPRGITGAKARPAGNASVAIILPAVQRSPRFSCGFRSPSSATLFHSTCLTLSPTDSTTSLREAATVTPRANSVATCERNRGTSKIPLSRKGDSQTEFVFPRQSSSSLRSW